jgi:hypothetical protein
MNAWVPTIGGGMVSNYDGDSWLTEDDWTPDEKVAAWILYQYQQGQRRDGPGYPDQHLLTCPEATATDITGGDGYYGCETGCEYVRLEARISCVHGQADVYHYGDFGRLGDILSEIG